MSPHAPLQVTVSSEKDRKSLQELLTVNDVAEFFDCTPLTVRRMISRGELRAYRVGRLIRIKPSDLDKAMRPVTNVATLLGGAK